MTEDSQKDAGITTKMREAGEKSVTQAKTAYAQYVTTAEHVLNTMEDWSRQAWSGARDVNARMLAFADENAKAGFDYADRFVKAKDAKEVLSLQGDYLNAQGERLAEQMRELGELSGRVARETAKAAIPEAASGRQTTGT